MIIVDPIEKRRKQVREATHRWRERNPGKTCSYDPAKRRASAKRYRNANPEKVAEYLKRWRQNNVERNRTRLAEWEVSNRGKRRAIVAKRIAAKRNASPPWVDE